VADGAELGEGVVIGPGCVVGPSVRLGDGCVLHAHVIVDGDTWVGPRTEIFPFTVIGTMPQDKKLRGAIREQGVGRLRIGADNEIREHVTIHGGTPFGSGVTVIGDRNMLLAGAHVGHDTRVGNDTVFTNGALVAGHCDIDDRAVLGAAVGIHQFCRVGRLAMVGAGSMVSLDVPPFAMVQGDRARLIGVNVVGLRRAGYSTEQSATIKRVFRLLFWRGGLLEERLANARAFADGDEDALRVLEFVASSQRGTCATRSRLASGEAPDVDRL
jgi:UDP-N-acetylglucosamine acyltransferase